MEEVSPNDVNVIDDPIVNNIVNKLLDNKDFKNKCIEKIKLIVADDKLDYKDIPHVVAIIMLIHKTEKIVNITKDKMKSVFETLIIRLLNELDVYKSLDDTYKGYINNAVEMAITLLLINVASNKFIEWIKKHLCGCLTKKEIIEDQHIKELENKLKK
jgi:hypothetical protein